MKCIYHNLPGPSSLFLHYPALVVKIFPSPSRLMSLLDPLAMFPLLLRCMNAYTDVNYLKSCPRAYEDEIRACAVPNRDPLVSPLLASPETLAQFPKTYLFSSTSDPCLDETIEFSNKLLDVGVPVSLQVFQVLPQAFLSLNSMSNECQKAVDVVSNSLKSLCV